MTVRSLDVDSGLRTLLPLSLGLFKTFFGDVFRGYLQGKFDVFILGWEGIIRV